PGPAFVGSESTLALARAASAAAGCGPGGVLLIGGAARSALVATIAAQIFATPITVPEPAEYVALGAARQAAWALAGTPQPPDWPARPAGAVQSSADDAATGAAIRARYRQAQTALYGG
uniref:FGGY-family carbohydrate kinase n=1 Tax=Nocardia brasiliensis TaxID=37326 RepID=UPI00245435F0